MCQQIAYTLFWNGCKNQNTQTVSEILAIIYTPDQQAGIHKTKVQTLYPLNIFLEYLKNLILFQNENCTIFVYFKNWKIFVSLIIFLSEVL